MTDAEILRLPKKYSSHRSILFSDYSGSPISWTDRSYRSIADIAEIERLRGENAKLSDQNELLRNIKESSIKVNAEYVLAISELERELKAARAEVETLESNLRVITYETVRIIQGNCYDGHGAGNQRLLDYANKLEGKG